MIVGPSLARRRARRVAEINAGASRLRQAFVTDIAGQQMVYVDKEAEAARWIAAEEAAAQGGPAPDLADYAWLPAEVGVTADTPSQLAQVWLNMAAIWRAAGPAIEETRLSAIAQAAASLTLAEIDQAAAQADGRYAALAALWGVASALPLEDRP